MVSPKVDLKEESKVVEYCKDGCIDDKVCAGTVLSQWDNCYYKNGAFICSCNNGYTPQVDANYCFVEDDFRRNCVPDQVQAYENVATAARKEERVVVSKE